MTTGGALSELNNLLNADDIPCYYKPSIKAVMDTLALEQESSKPMVEIDLYSVIKQKYIEREVLDKIRAEIKKSSHGKWYVGRLDGKTEEVLLLDEVLQIIDKYKAEIES
jgi:hypothetical protein